MQRSSPTQATHPALTALSAALALAFALPAQAASELEELKAELAQQRKLLEQQQKVIERLEHKVASQESSQAALQAKAEAQAAAVKPGGSAGVTLYGILDGGVEHITNIGAGHDKLTRVPGITGTVASRLGVRAEKDLAAGFKGIATLEAGFNLDNGTLGQGGRIFGRQLFAGFATPYGEFTFGRQYSMLLYGMFDSDLLGPNIYALGSFDPYLPNARFDNSVAWRAKFSSVALGASFSFGRDTNGGTPLSGTCAGEIPGQASACRAWSAFAKYDAPTFGVAAAIDEQRGGSGATASFFNGAPTLAFASPGDKDRRITAGAYLKFGKAKVGLGWLGRKLHTSAPEVESDTYYLDGAYSFSPTITLDGGVMRINNDVQKRDATMFVVRGFYHFDKDLSAYLQLAHLTNSSLAAYALSGAGPGTAPAAGGDQNGYMLGLRYRF
jgi:predicted porin